ncbi:putative ribonuclease H-like domain-containing protein [Tanacetum coccineum]
MTGNKCYLDEYEDYDGGFVSFGDGKGRISRKGKIKTGSLDFDDVYFCKELKYNLFSVSQIYDKKKNVLFTDTECLVLSSNFKLLDESQVLLRVPRKDNIYSVDLKSVVPTGGLTCLIAKATIDESNTWHRRLRHINFKTMNKLVKGNLVKGLPSKIFENDHSCVAFVTDDFSRFSWVFFLATKDETSGILKTFITEIENQLDHKVKVIRSDNGIEFKNSIMNQFCEMKGIKREFSVARTPQQHGVAERKNRTLIEVTRTMEQTNSIAGTKDNIVAGQAQKEKEPEQEYILIPLCTTDPLISQGPKDYEGDAGMKLQIPDTSFTKFHKDHPEDQVIGSLKTPVQTRHMTKINEEHGLISSVHKLRRTNHKDFQNCLFACFLSQMEPKKPVQALKDPSWVEAMQDELLQFKLLKVWTLVDLPRDKWAIGTKWVFRNKKDERGIVVKNKARLVAQGHTQEEGIDYDEVFAPSVQPPSFEDPYFPDKVYKVEKALYGLHQALRVVQQKSDGIFISQDKYVAEILKKFDFASVKTASTPMETNKALIKDEEAEDVDVHLYRSMIRSLMYLTASRPDIMFVVCACARFQVTPKTSHLNAVKRIFRYLKGQPKLGLWYPRDSPFDLEAFSDSDYAGASLDRKSTTGGCQFLGKRLISWQCKKQTIVANSTTEAEYVAAANCCGQVLWIQNQMLDYGFNFMNTKIYIDNESTICIVKNPVFHSKTKHIEIRHHFIRDSYEKKLIQVIKIHTDQNVADLLTKAFDASRFNFLIASIGLLNL